MNTRATIFVLFLTICVGAHADEIERAELKIAEGTAHLTSTVLRDWVVDLSTFCAAAAVEDGKILSDAVVGPYRYVLLDLKGPSRTTDKIRFCGVGTEENLVWLKIPENWRIDDSKSFLLNSCFRSVEGSPVGNAKDRNVLEWKAVSHNEKKKYLLQYDIRQPDKGLQISAEPATP